jgi:hypothetical protein
MVHRISSLGLLVALVVAPGCFAFEEMDEGMERWSRNSEQAAGSVAAPEAPPPRSARGRPSGWEGVRSLGHDATPGDIVRCILDGRSHYMRESDCVGRGGRVTS